MKKIKKMLKSIPVVSLAVFLYTSSPLISVENNYYYMGDSHIN